MTLTPHLQGCICCWEPQSMYFFKRQIPEHICSPWGDACKTMMHALKKKGTPRQKLDQGRRTDIVELKRKIEQGLHPTDLAMGNDGFIPIVAKFSRFAQGIRTLSNGIAHSGILYRALTKLLPSQRRLLGAFVEHSSAERWVVFALVPFCYAQVCVFKLFFCFLRSLSRDYYTRMHA